MVPGASQCCYVGKSSERCQREAILGGQFCFWHDPTVDKSGEDVKERLQALAKSGQSLEGFLLKHAKLGDIRLSSPRGHINFSGSDLYRADLKGAHLYNADLSGCSLMKADLTGANLNNADLRGANLLGAILTDTKVERTKWGPKIKHEIAAEFAQVYDCKKEAQRFYTESEEIYRNLRKACESKGLFEDAGHFFQKEMRTKRLQLPLWTKKRFFSKLVEVVSGYGERPFNVVVFALGLVLVCAFLYFIFGVVGPGGNIGYNSELSIGGNIEHFINALYFSIVTFTTLGYGDITPSGIARAIAAFEAFTGSFAMALFVVVFVKKMTR